MSDDSLATGVQQSLTGDDAERVVCEYYDGCESPALYIDEILHYGEGEQPVRMCKSCANEHTEVPDNEVQRLKPEDRYVGEQPDPTTVWVVAGNYADDPHPHILGVYDDEADADEKMEECRDRFSEPHVVAWDKTEQEVV